MPHRKRITSRREGERIGVGGDDEQWAVIGGRKPSCRLSQKSRGKILGLFGVQSLSKSRQLYQLYTPSPSLDDPETTSSMTCASCGDTADTHVRREYLSILY